MAKLEILTFPDARLRKKAVAIEHVNDEVRQIADDMIETMYYHGGIGLAAIQVNIRKALIVMDLSDQKNDPRQLINPVITHAEGEIVMAEGCLSFPEFRTSIKRAEHVRVNALDVNGEAVELEASGLAAICLQHELDHLNGKLFVDYLSPLKRFRLMEKFKKEKPRRQRSRQDDSATGLSRT